MTSGRLRSGGRGTLQAVSISKDGNDIEKYE